MLFISVFESIWSLEWHLNDLVQEFQVVLHRRLHGVTEDQ